MGGLRTDLDAERKYARDITGWIKLNLGPNLEKVSEFVVQLVDKELKEQAEETKKREEGLWMIFGRMRSISLITLSQEV